MILHLFLRYFPLELTSLVALDAMVKLRVFQLFEYDRIIFLDSDMMVRRNLDHLFFLPETSHIAGPRVYFQHSDGRPDTKPASKPADAKAVAQAKQPEAKKT